MSSFTACNYHNGIPTVLHVSVVRLENCRTIYVLETTNCFKFNEYSVESCETSDILLEFSKILSTSKNYI